MKNSKYLLLLLVSTFFFQQSVTAQPASSLSPERLLITDTDAEARLLPSYLEITNNNTRLHTSLRAGNLVLSSNYDSKVLSASQESLLLREDYQNNTFTAEVVKRPRSVQFRTRTTTGIDIETWTLGNGNFGIHNPNDPVMSIFTLKSNRINSSTDLDHYFLRANPTSGSLSIGTENVGVSTQLFVNEEGESTASIWAAHSGSSNANNSFGVYGSNISLGSSNHFGVFGYGSGASGTSYGVYGQAGSGNTTYGVYASGNLAYTGNLSNVSDRKFKKNIKPFSALDRVMQLQPRTYDMKRDQYRRMHLAEGRQFGFIAQELQEVFPELVHQGMHVSPYEDEPGQLLSEEIDYLGVDYISLVPILTQAIQEQQELIDEKDRRITRLEAQNDQLSERLTEVETVLRELINSTSEREEQVPGSSSGASLMQNWPNPFRGNTTVPFYLPNDINRAELQITDVNGRVLQTRTISGRGKGHLNLAADAWSSGIYFCSLLVDGKIVDTRQMRVQHQ